MAQRDTTADAATLIDSWLTELRELEPEVLAGSNEAIGHVRHMASAVSACAASAGIPSLEGPADAITTGLPEEVPVHFKNLCTALDDALQQISVRRNVVVVSGFDRATAHSVRHAMREEGLRALVSESPDEALRMICGEELASVVIALGEGADWIRSVSVKLHENPLTAGTPILVVGPERALHELDQSCLGVGDGTMPSEAGVKGVLRWVLQRRRRMRETIRAARRDRITGLLNRAALLEQLQVTQTVSRRTGEPVTVAVIGLSSTMGSISSLDDTAYGEVLMRMSSACSQTFRATDVIARIGNSKFAVMFPGEDPEGTERALVRLARQLESHPIHVGTHLVTLKAKAGITALSQVADPHLALDEALSLLDEAEASSDTLFRRFEAGTSDDGGVVLMAQPQSHTAEILGNLLEQEGYRVVRLAQAERVPEVVGQEGVSLAIVDEELGLEAADSIMHALRQQPATADSLIMVLGREQGDSTARQEAIGEMRAVEYVSRPFTVGPFMQRVRERLGGRRDGHDGPEIDSRCRLLVVDPHVGRLMLAANALHRSGDYTVLLSRDFKDAVKRFLQDRPQALFVTLDGGETGNSMADWLIQDRRLSKMPVVVAADVPNMRGAERIRYSGGAGTVDLPYDAQRLPLLLAEKLGIELGTSGQPLSRGSLDEEIRRVMASR